MRAEVWFDETRGKTVATPAEGLLANRICAVGETEAEALEQLVETVRVLGAELAAAEIDPETECLTCGSDFWTCACDEDGA